MKSIRITESAEAASDFLSAGTSVMMIVFAPKLAAPSARSVKLSPSSSYEPLAKNHMGNASDAISHRASLVSEYESIAPFT